jgi:hypothetical protein
MALVVVAGPIANKPLNSGESWVELSWLLGLRRLGCAVLYVEQITPATCTDVEGRTVDFERSLNRSYFRAVMDEFDLREHSALVLTGSERTEGLSWQELVERVAEADLLVNISGHLELEPLRSSVRRRAYIDLDPGFTQLWMATGDYGKRLEGHELFFTVGERIGDPDCAIPSGGVEWRHLRQPVVLDEWPAASGGEATRFTTIASWRGAYGPVEFGGRVYGLKVHEFRKVIELPRRLPFEFEIALDIHSGDHADLAALREHGWQVADPRAVVPDPASFRRYVRESGAEFSVAQGIYVETNSGWFSDRTAAYLASGRPALVQDTGFSRTLPTGEGLVAFTTMQEAVAGARAICGAYEQHSRAARALAETYFDSDHVLGALFDRPRGVSGERAM